VVFNLAQRCKVDSQQHRMIITRSAARPQVHGASSIRRSPGSVRERAADTMPATMHNATQRQVAFEDVMLAASGAPDTWCSCGVRRGWANVEFEVIVADLPEPLCQCHSVEFRERQAQEQLDAVVQAVVRVEETPCACPRRCPQRPQDPRHPSAP